MTLRLTPRQYKTLVRALCLAQSIHEGAALTEDQEPGLLKELERAVLNQAHDFLESGDPFLDNPDTPIASLNTNDESMMYEVKTISEENAFWDILADRLALRDIAQCYTANKWSWMSNQDKDRVYQQFLEQYIDELWTQGITNLHLVEKEKRLALPDWDPADPLSVGASLQHTGLDQIDSMSALESSRSVPGGNPGGTKIIRFPGNFTRDEST